MNGQQIRKLIDENNDKILDLLKKEDFNFVLNPQIAELLEQNEELQHMCVHSFAGGKCIFCDTEEIK